MIGWRPFATLFLPGNNFYSLLTGYYPFFDTEDNESIRVSKNICEIESHPLFALFTYFQHDKQQKLKDGVTAKIDPRFYDKSFAERKLIEVIKRCYVYDPDERADINEIQHMLEVAIAEDERRIGTEWDPDAQNELEKALSEDKADHSDSSEEEDEDEDNGENDSDGRAHGSETDGEHGDSETEVEDEDEESFSRDHPDDSESEDE